MMTPKISNMSAYTEELKKTLLDKIYFLDKIDAKLIVDFGCADGTMLKFIRDLFGDAYELMGYDANPDMIRMAKQGGNGIFFTSQWEEIKGKMQAAKTANLENQTALVLNSVVHEVYSYCNSSQIDKFWKMVWGGDFDYVCVRDMMPNRSIDRPADVTEVAKVRAKADPDKLQLFEETHGSIDNNKNLIHYLLKYRYVQNWEREARESYFPLTTQKFLAMIPHDYCIDYYEEYLLPFAKRKVNDDFGITLRDSTHVKVVMRRCHLKNERIPDEGVPK